MILNEYDFNRTRVSISMLKGRCDRLSLRIADPRQEASAQAEIVRVQQRIDELNEQLRTYRSLLCDRDTTSETVRLIDVPDRLIQRRLALGLTQADLGGACGQTRQCMSRYERTRYASASLARLIQVDLMLRAEEVRQSAAEASLAILL